jgi:hypothetical protein
MPNVKASSCSASASSRTVTVGNSVTVYVRGNDAIGKFSVGNSNGTVLTGGASSLWVEGTASVSYKANTSGSATISFNSSDVSNSNGDPTSASCSVTITVVNKSSNSSNTQSNNTSNNNKETKSSVNTLKSLKVEGSELSPKFDSGTTEYNVTVSNDTEKIKITAEAKDSKASVTGTGEKNVSEGTNKFNVVVTAENGYKKTYTINVEVEEDPIEVTINNQKFTVVKKENSMPEKPEYFDNTTVTIQEKEIPAYKGTILDYTLVALKDEDGNVNLYIYDNDEYTLYSEIKFSSITLYMMDMDKKLLPDNYKKYTITINDEEVEVYKLNKKSNYSLIYGLNVETGEKHLYKYDENENTLQIYEREEAKLLEEKIEDYNKLIIILGIVILLLILLVTIAFTRKPKIKDEDELSKKDIKKIEKETKKEKKKK